MKKWVAICAVLVSMSFVSTGQSAEPGEIDGSALSALGLSGMQQMSDDEGTNVRGRFARVSGYSQASVFGGTFSENSYFAAGSRIAAGANGSIAFRSFGRGFFRTTVVVGAGGGSIAYSR